MRLAEHQAGRTIRNCIFVLVVLCSATSARAVDDADLARRQSDQRHARVMAQQLVSSVLDLQLRQLEENGLTDLPVYADIQLMRGHLSELVDREMAAVIQRLVEAQSLQGSDRDTKFVEARQAIRDVVIRLSIERQALMRRLKAAEILEQTRRLLELQSSARTDVAGLLSLPEDRRPEAALKALEDQRDIQGLFTRLVETLDDVRTWDGEIATAASEGLRVIKGANLVDEFAAVELSLNNARYDDGVAHQDAVIAVLEKLLAVIEQAQATSSSEREELLETVRQLKQEQQTLHDDIEKDGLTEPPRPETVEAQQRITRTLDEIADRLARDPLAAPLREQAATAAKAATEALFSADEERTLAEQQRAVDRLGALEEVLARSQDEVQDRSAAELAHAAHELESARNELQQAVAKHAEAASTADHRAASEAERAAAHAAARIRDGKSLPADVAARLADAADAARTASEALAATSDEQSKQKAESAVGEAGRSLQRAQAAVEENLADTQRAAAAVKIGELARAAEALERAAAAEREVSMQATAAAKGKGLSAEEANALKQVQQDVSGVAAKTAEGVKDAAPDVAETLAKAGTASKRADEALSEAATKPGEASKPAAERTAQAAGETSKELTNAAAALRSRIGDTASQLAELAGEQLKPVAAAQQAVQNAAASATDQARIPEAARSAAEAAAKAEVGATSAAQAAEQAAGEAGAERDVTDALDRAAISLAAREQRLKQDQELAKQLAQLANRQQDAANAIAEARQNLDGAPSEPAAMSEPQQQAARSLHSATRQFSAAQRATGQGAAQISGQQQIANVPIREALQTAERLPVPQLPGEPARAPSEVADAAEPSSEGEAAEASDQASDTAGNDAKPSDASQQAASSGAQSQNQAGSTSSPAGAAQAKGLGTRLVPAAPEETARMMAGPEAQAALAAMEAALAAESMEDVAASETADAPPDGAPSQNLDGDQQAQKGDAETAGSPAQADSQTPEGGGRDSNVGPGAANAGWFAKLPADVRAAIRASASQPAPKGYEGRLRRYFESVDE